MLFAVTVFTVEAWREPPTKTQAQFKGFPLASVPLQVNWSSAQTMENFAPPSSGCSMLRSVPFKALTLGEPTGVRGDVLPLVDSKTGHVPGRFAPDQSAESIIGNV